MKKDTTLDIMDIMFKISRLMKAKMSFHSDLMDLSVLQIQALVFLGQREKMTMSDIAEHFHIEMPSATSLINKLYDLKLVDRYADPEDRRVVRAGLTVEGKKMFEQAFRQRRQKLEKFLSYLSEEDRVDLLRILGSLQGQLEK